MRMRREVHVRQHDQTDCGVACLLSVLRHFGGDSSLERLRALSGTGPRGTTLLGLYQAARELGLEAEGYHSDTGNLKTCTDPCILHIIRKERLQHYVVCYGFRDGHFLISDPSESAVRPVPESQLAAEWPSGNLLLLRPTDRLVKRERAQRARQRWLWRLLRDDVNILATALVIGVVVAFLGLVTALFSQKLIDDILPARDTLRLSVGLGALFGLLLARGGLSYLRQLFLLRQSRDFNVRIVDHFYGALLHLPKSFFDTRKTGDLIARMNDTQRIQRTIARLAGSVMIDGLIVVAATTAVFWYDTWLGWATFGWLPIFAYLAYRFHPAILRGQKAVMAAYAHNESHYVDTIQGIGVIKAANRQSVFARATRAIYGLFQEAQYDLGKVTIRFALAGEAAAAVFIVGILGWSAFQVLQDALTAGALVAVLQLSGLVMASAAQLVATNIQLQEARVAFDRMYELTSLEPEYRATNASEELPAFRQLDVRSLSFRFPGRQRLLQDITLSVGHGEWVSVLGESGCGKSTLLQILQKFYPPEGGAIMVDDRPLEDIDFECWRRLIGVVPQEVKVFNNTLLNNILLGSSSESPEIVVARLEEWGFDRFFNRLPNGYATLVGEGGVNLSGGQRQLLALARALVHEPRLLLLDEPTAALDRDTECFVLNLLERLKNNGKGILLLTHRLRTARRADRIYIIEQGVTHQAGDHAALLQSDNLYSRAWRDLVGSSG